MGNIVEELAEFTLRGSCAELPDEVVEESKRLLLDSVGCALAATEEPKGKIGIEFARFAGGAADEATVIGTTERASVLGAAYANAELINALDFDSVLPPGHVSPYVLPGALAVAETGGASGQELIAAIAVSHEMSYRFGLAMDSLRNVKDGKSAPPPIAGYSSTVFGATAAVARLNGDSQDVVESALGIAGAISPVNAHRAWTMHSPSSTIKYLLAGALAQTALTAERMAALGHRGDVQILDDAEFGYRRFIGTGRWEPEHLTNGLGSEWNFPGFVSYKPYPHCRILHGQIDVLIEILESNDIKPGEIEGIKAWGEGWVEQPVWLNREIEHVHDAQFSMAHGLALAAHRARPGREWQDPDLVFSDSVMDLMGKTETAIHPEYAERITANSASRPSRVEVSARGETFVGESSYPKGSPSPEPDSLMSTDELIAKFRVNAAEVLSAGRIDEVIETVLGLDSLSDSGQLMRLLARDNAGS